MADLVGEPLRQDAPNPLAHEALELRQFSALHQGVDHPQGGAIDSYQQHLDSRRRGLGRQALDRARGPGPAGERREEKGR
ncbi:MAG: hypothetical protein V3T81_08220 [Thermoanaerobaculia bacterium]